MLPPRDCFCGFTLPELLDNWGFCPKCGVQVTHEAHDADERATETMLKDHMLAREEFIKTWKVPDIVKIPMGKSLRKITMILGQPYSSFPQEDDEK